MVEDRNQDEEDEEGEEGEGEELDEQGGNTGNVVDRDIDDDGGDYGHAERAFLQAFLARSVMTGKEVGSLLRRIWRVKAERDSE